MASSTMSRGSAVLRLVSNRPGVRQSSIQVKQSHRAFSLESAERLVTPPWSVAGTSSSGPALTRSPDRKGKGRATPQNPAFEHLGGRFAALHSSKTLSYYLRHPHGGPYTRSFHSSTPRHAIPLIPASIGILKSTTVLAAVTAFSRILISFFPIGTIATFKILRSNRWVTANITKPEVGPEAEEFWKMWCEGEQPVRFKNSTEAKPYFDGVKREDGGYEGPGGQVAYSIPFPPHPRFEKSAKRDKDGYVDPSEYDHEWRTRSPSRALRWFKRARFIIPPLPSASVSFYEALSPEVQLEIHRYRRYWTGMRAWQQNLRFPRIFTILLFGLPFFLLSAVYLLGLERVPLTGRWRIILLSPEEEEAISSSLAGPNWYKSVLNILTTPEKPAPPILSYADWRWRWVSSVLRRLESGLLAECHGQPLPYGSPVIPVPKAEYPVKPRPRMSWMLYSHMPGNDIPANPSHLEVGPPYSLLILEKDEENAFSYGFGGKGAGGVVVYTGLLDEILRTHDDQVPDDPASSNVLSRLFSGLFGPSAPTHPQPTEAQNLQLASVLAHEMGHLVLSHHLETLSQQQVLWPSVLGLGMDLTRAFIWPITWILGPTVNDALANVGKTSADEMADRYGQIGFQWKHEYEADLAGLRILGLGGYDPRAALAHFSESVASLHEIQPLDREGDSWTGSLFRFWTRSTHPTPEQRAASIRTELGRWEREAATSVTDT